MSDSCKDALEPVLGAWPATVATSVPQTPSSDVLLRFDMLPQDLVRTMLDCFLLAPDTITNPWNYDREGYTNMSLLPNIIATCKAYNVLGMRILYTQNVFCWARVTSITASHSDCSRDISNLRPNTFLEQLHLRRDGLKSVRRGELIKNFVFKDREGVHKVPEKLSWTPGRHFNFQFKALRSLEWLGFRLRNLTITIDETIPKAVEFIDYERRMRLLSHDPVADFDNPTSDQEITHRVLQWKFLGESPLEPYCYTNTDWAYSTKGLIVDTLYIRGTSPHRRQFTEYGEPIVSNDVAAAIEKFLESTSIVAKKVVFAGALKQ